MAYSAEKELRQEDEEITAKSIKARMTGADKEQKTIVELFKAHNEKMKSLISKDYAEATYKKYRTAFKHIKSFMKSEHNSIELLITKVDTNFLEDFEYYLKTEKECSHNSAMKYLSNFKKITNKAIKNGWLEDDPFDHFDHSYKKKDPVFLTQAELRRIEEKEFAIDRLDRIRDVFIFSCYTGLGFSDAKKLKQSDIKQHNDGEFYLYLPRTKTGKNAKVLLMPKAL